MFNLLSCVEIDPPITARGSVIWLHGLGADANDFVPMVSELNLPKSLPLRFVFPEAPLRPVTINNGYVMRAWYDIVSMNVDQHADRSGMDDTITKLQQLIEHEEQQGVACEHIVLAGFSQGALIALAAGLTYPKRLGGILALSGYLPHTKEVATLNTANQATPIFLGHGTQDTVVPYQLGEQLFHTLQALNYNVSWHSYMMPHSVCATEVEDIKNWLMKIY